MRRAGPLTWLVVLAVASAGCASNTRRVRDATAAARSWAATVQVVAEQWSQSRVSRRFTRTTLETAATDLSRQAESIRSIDPAAAARIDRLRDAIGPVMAAVAHDAPDGARDAASALTAMTDPRSHTRDPGDVAERTPAHADGTR